MYIWPKEISAARNLLPDGVVEYKLAHSEIGELGRIVIMPVNGGGTDIRYDVFKSVDDDGLH